MCRNKLNKAHKIVRIVCGAQSKCSINVFFYSNIKKINKKERQRHNGKFLVAVDQGS